MAYNPYFTFADPQLQAAVVQEAQIQAAAQAAQAQQRAQTLAAMRQERQLQADREERRAIRQADIARQEAAAAEQRRQFDVGTVGLTEKDIASREKIAGAAATERAAQEKERAEAARYTAALRGLERADADGLPTEKELETQIVDFSPEHKEGLRLARQRVYRNLLSSFNLVNDEETRLNAELSDPKKGLKAGLKMGADELISGSPAQGQLRINPRTGRIEGLLRPPRVDVSGPQEPPRGAALRGAQPIADIISGLAQRAGAAVPGILAAGEAEARRPFNPARLLNLFAPGGLGIAPFIAGGYGRQAAPVVPRVAPAPAMLGNQGILAPLDYGGPQYDYSRLPGAIPEDFLAPPVFAPSGY